MSEHTYKEERRREVRYYDLVTIVDDWQNGRTMSPEDKHLFADAMAEVCENVLYDSEIVYLFEHYLRGEYL